MRSGSSGQQHMMQKSSGRDAGMGRTLCVTFL